MATRLCLRLWHMGAEIFISKAGVGHVLIAVGAVSSLAEFVAWPITLTLLLTGVALEWLFVPVWLAQLNPVTVASRAD